MDTSIGRLPPATLRDWILDGHELALLDAREEGEFAAGHLFWAVPFPLSRAELRLPLLLPRLSVRTVCVDDGSGLAERLAEYLLAKGATDVHMLDGGTRAWADAGFVLFTGAHVPSDAFGMWIEQQYGTESVDPSDLKSWLDEGRSVTVVDTRASHERRPGTIQGATDVLSGDLAYRVVELAPDTLIVVAGASHAGSVLGAESLRRVGVPNRVLALRGGVMGWELAGLPLVRDSRQHEAPPEPGARSVDRAKAFAESSGVGVIGALDLARFEEDPDRTVYVLDVRSPAEYAARHRPGSRNAPGGQLIAATDTWVGARGARIALIDAHGVRARVTGAWLHQMGHRDVFVVEGGLDDLAEPGPALDIAPEADETDTIPADALVLDLARSTEFRAGHVPGAIWAVRTRLGSLRERLAASHHVVLTSPLGILARLAVAEVRGLTDARVEVLRGGTRGWADRGNTLAADPAEPPDDACIDACLRPHERNSGVEQAMRAHLDWEKELLREIERDGTVQFGV